MNKLCAVLVCLSLTVPFHAHGAKPYTSCFEAKHEHTTLVKISESAGFARSSWPVEVQLRFQAKTLKAPDAVRLLKIEGEKKLPTAYQVVEVTSESRTNKYEKEPLIFVQIVFMADVKANGSTTYEVTLEEGDQPAHRKTVAVTGEGVGKAIDTGVALYEIHPKCGQILAVTPQAGKRERMYFYPPDASFLPVHFNPDVCASDRRWGHVAEWNAPVNYDARNDPGDDPVSDDRKSAPYFYLEKSGPLLFRTTRWGKMPSIPEVKTGVTYSFFAGTPFVTGSSFVEFMQSGSFNAVRMGEIVFDHRLFDHLVWIDDAGEVHDLPCWDYDNPEADFGIMKTLPLDAPCTGFFNERKKTGIAYINLGTASMNKYSGYATGDQAHTEFLHWPVKDPKAASYHYVSREMVFRDNYTPSYVQKGSLYSCQFAICVFGSYKELSSLWRMISNPLSIEAD